MLSDEGFDLWADGYDRSVSLSDEDGTYPFAGYKAVLGKIYQTIMQGGGVDILDIGFGTGVLTLKLCNMGCNITGVDFSQRMVEIARERMPKAELILHDFTKGLPHSLSDKGFDYIVCTYAVHHLTRSEQIMLIKEMTGCLRPNGRLLIGDVAFISLAEMETCKAESGGDWDDDEVYPIVDIMKKDFPDVEFERLSFCAGVLSFSK
ncbi:MAG TPA: class I SAM-dependent methyltransferase [Eubacteriales bacterium]|nr:class I SAM-dependent methyltransferase [Clostridia bacterium]HRV72249.1 class I SAM-dependent methyltransferase [Eubacteriales bacterium]